jgi:hypothetical protein
MRTKSDSAADGEQQASAHAAYRRAVEARTKRVVEEPWLKHPMPDVAAFVAAHGVTVCPPGQTTKLPKKPASKPARPRKLHAQCWTMRRAVWRKKSKAELDAWVKRPATADIPAPTKPRSKRAANKRHAFLQRKGRADWRKFKKEHPQVARERLEMLAHFKSI